MLIILQVLAILFSALVLILVLLEWSRREIRLDFQDFYKHPDVEDALAAARNKFLEQVRLLAWEIRRSTDSAREQEYAERIFSSSNDAFDDCMVRNGEMHVELITAENEEEIEVDEIRLTIPRHMRWRVIRLFAASRFIHGLLDWN